MLSPRWTKIWRDAWLVRTRLGLMVLTLAVGMAGVATMLSANVLLKREVTRNYVDTAPAEASLELDNVDAAVLAAVRARPDILAAQGAARQFARVETAPGQFTPLLLYVQQDFNEPNINRLDYSGAPPPGSMLVERDAMSKLDAHVGQAISLTMRDGSHPSLIVSGSAHDPSQPPASSSIKAYAYIGAASLPALGLPTVLPTLRIRIKGAHPERAAIEAVAADVARQLATLGHPVTRISVPPPGQHPHQVIMDSLLGMMLVFAAITLLLATILSANMMAALLARQTRQIGVMKAIGARSGAIGRLYLAQVAVVALVACAIGLPLGLLAGRAYAKMVLVKLMNFNLGDPSMPAWVIPALLATGLLLPLTAAALPLWRAAAQSVRSALDANGVDQQGFGRSRIDAWLGRWRGLEPSLALALRNCFRRRARLLLTLGLLTAAGASFIASLSVNASSARHLREAGAQRLHQIELSLNRPQDAARTLALLTAVPGVQAAEAWPAMRAAPARPDGLSLDHAYPDGGHDVLTLAAVPDASAMLKLPLTTGRWLADGEADAVVLNGPALEFFPQAQVGGTLAITANGRTRSLRVVGIARQYMSGAAAYVAPAGFAPFSNAPELVSTYRIRSAQSDDASVAALARQLEAALEANGNKVSQTITEAMMRKEVDGHFDLLVRAMLFVSLLCAAVGLLGLMSAMGNNVAERGRELGIMRAMGARPGQLMRNIVLEGSLIGLFSAVLALLVSVPLSFALCSFLGNMMFGFALPMALAPGALGMWLLIAVLGAAAASAQPARQAGHMSVHAALALL